MRHFRLKKTITHVTVLSALFPTGLALSHQVQIPIGLSGKITLSAAATAVIGHQVIPAGLAPMDPSTAPARGGYVYDAFNRVVRTGVTGECVKHGFWTPEIATPDCEPWLFAPPAPAPKAAAAAPVTAEPAPAVKKEEGFPEWIGPDEFRVGVVPTWPVNEFDVPNNIGLPRMYYGDDTPAHGEHTDDLISAPTLYGDYDVHEGDRSALVSPPVMYYHDDETGVAAADDLISAPRHFSDDEGTGVAPFVAGQWPADPFVAGIPEEAPPADESNDNWMPAPIPADRVATPAPGIMEFKEEGVWPTSPYAGGYVEDQPVIASDDSWVIPNPSPSEGTAEAVGPFAEDGIDPVELISNPVMYFDTEDRGIIPPQLIIGHTLVQTEEPADDGAVRDDLISAPRVYEDTPDTDTPAVVSAAPYDGSEFSNQPYPVEEEEDDDLLPYPGSMGNMGDDQLAAAVPPAAPVVAEEPAPAVQDTVPPYAAAEEDEEEQVDLQPYTSDLSNVPVAKGANETLPTPSVAATPAPAAEKSAPVVEEHMMTVVLSADALFEFDRYAVRKGGNKGLRDFVAALKEVKWGQILVVGHTDRLGSDKYNQRLSERRAQTVRRELIKFGLDGKKIKAIGKGKSEPVTKDCVGDKRSNALIECLQPDRRVEIFVDENQQVIIKKAPGN